MSPDMIAAAAAYLRDDPDAGYELNGPQTRLLANLLEAIATPAPFTTKHIAQLLAGTITPPSTKEHTPT